jgi:NAD(P)-dependent dehydrogenase (short-subunit alcohol dehydrogenase family)
LAGRSNTGEPVAIVTGVSRGLGAALASELLDRGFVVLGVGRTTNGELDGDRYSFVQLDLSDSERVDAALERPFEELKERRPSSVCLLNNAATVDPAGTLGRLTAGVIVAGLAVNLASAVALANLFLRVFADGDLPRRVVNVSSGAAANPLTGESVYSVSKAGIEMMTRALAAEQQAPTFRAVTVRPGVIDTGMQVFARSQSADVLPSVELFKGFHREGRLVPPEVVAEKIVDRLVVGEVEHGRTYSYHEL